MKRIPLQHLLIPVLMLVGALAGGCAKREITINAIQKEKYADSSMLVDVYTAMGSDTLDFGTSRFIENNLAYTGKSGEKLALRVWYPAGRQVDTSRLVLLIPGYGGTTVDLFPLATELVRRGFVTAMISPRGEDLNAGLQDDYGVEGAPDASAAIDAYARRHNLAKPVVGVFGVSLGGVTALNLAAADKRVKAVATEGLPLDLETTAKRMFSGEEMKGLQSRFGGRESEFHDRSPETVLPKIFLPLYGVWGENDKLVTEEERVKLKALMERSTTSSTRIVKKGGHSLRYGFPLTLDEAKGVNAGIADFLQMNIPS